MNIKKFLSGFKEKTLLEAEAKTLLKALGIEVPNGVFIRKGQNIEYPFSYPVIAKVSSRLIGSKTDVLGIIPNIRDKEQLNSAVERLLLIEHSEGVLVEEMMPPSLEAIVGGLIDDEFGPVVMFGLGGIFVELFRDVSFGLAPIDRENALKIIKEIKGYRLLEGYRGSPPIDLNPLIKIMISASEIIASGLVHEIDLNPIALYPKKAIALDAKIKLL